MKNNPKVFFDYVKKQDDRDTKVGPFKIKDEYIYDAKKICNLLVNQYNSQFSDNKYVPEVNKEIFSNTQEDLTDIEINEKDYNRCHWGIKYQFSSRTRRNTSNISKKYQEFHCNSSNNNDEKKSRRRKNTRYI